MRRVPSRKSPPLSAALWVRKPRMNSAASRSTAGDGVPGAAAGADAVGALSCCRLRLIGYGFRLAWQFAATLHVILEFLRGVDA